MTYLLILIVGLIIGAAAILLVTRLKKKDEQALAKELVFQAQAEKLQDLENFLSRMKDSFYAVSLDALNKNINNFMEMAKSTLSQQTTLGAKDLDSKKELIFQTYEQMKAELEKVNSRVAEFEKDRQNKYGELSNQLARLGETTGKLTEALASSGVRGQWGQRMAEDVLKLAGFIEGINYFKQKTLDASSGRPDYTFPLPNQQIVNMDVKFPFANYWQFLEAKNDDEKIRYRELFLKDVRRHLKALTDREYISHDDHTIDMVIMFIPNEQVYSFINQYDRSIIDDAIASKVAICSPLTLFAILAIIRQATDNFNLERTANEILGLMGNFYKQWGAFIESLEQLGRKVESANAEYQKLITTRKAKLQKPLDQIEQLRRQKGLPIVENGGLSEGSLPPPSAD